MVLWMLGRKLIEEGALVPGREDSEFVTCEVIPWVDWVCPMTCVYVIVCASLPQIFDSSFGS